MSFSGADSGRLGLTICFFSSFSVSVRAAVVLSVFDSFALAAPLRVKLYGVDGWVEGLREVVGDAVGDAPAGCSQSNSRNLGIVTPGSWNFLPITPGGSTASGCCALCLTTWLLAVIFLSTFLPFFPFFFLLLAGMLFGLFTAFLLLNKNSKNFFRDCKRCKIDALHALHFWRCCCSWWLRWCSSHLDAEVNLTVVTTVLWSDQNQYVHSGNLNLFGRCQTGQIICETECILAHRISFSFYYLSVWLTRSQSAATEGICKTPKQRPLIQFGTFLGVCPLFYVLFLSHTISCCLLMFIGLCGGVDKKIGGTINQWYVTANCPTATLQHYILDPWDNPPQIKRCF